MGFAPKENIKRNEKLFKLKQGMTFEELADYFDISVARAKEIYYKVKAKKAVKV